MLLIIANEDIEASQTLSKDTQSINGQDKISVQIIFGPGITLLATILNFAGVPNFSALLSSSAKQMFNHISHTGLWGVGEPINMNASECHVCGDILQRQW